LTIWQIKSSKKRFSFFKWSERERLSTGNPVDLIERLEIDRNPEFLAPEEATDLLKGARDTNGDELLAYVSIAVFAGLRPDSELKKLTWRGVNFEDGEIQVPKGKTRVARTVKASANLMEFLSICDRRKPIIPKGNFQRKFAAVKRAAGFKGGVSDSKRLKKIESEPGRKPWIPDVTRHSYITYHVREHGDIYKTATSAGNSPSVIKAHYEGAAKSSEATSFWGITPNTLDGADIVNIKTA
jgi:integrase